MFETKNGVNYYEVLEVAYDAPQHEVHKAYTRAKATYASDNPALYSMFTVDESRDLLKLIEEAYSVLGNHGLRRNYDEVLRKGGGTPRKLASVSNTPSAAPTNVEADHNALPDFMVPDPSIPGSFEEKPSNVTPMPIATASPYTAPQTHVAPVPQAPAPVVVQAPQEAPPVAQPLMDPIHAAATGKRESILVTNSEFTVRKRESTMPLMPPDTGRCPLGTYKIDEGMENEIAERTEFDGPFLQKVRVYKGVSLEKLSVSSRIGKTYLIALESNDFKNLPAPVFLRGFLVQMGKQLGIDENKVVTSYMNLAKASGKYGS